MNELVRSRHLRERRNIERGQMDVNRALHEEEPGQTFLSALLDRKCLESGDVGTEGRDPRGQQALIRWSAEGLSLLGSE